MFVKVRELLELEPELEELPDDVMCPVCLDLLHEPFQVTHPSIGLDYQFRKTLRQIQYFKHLYSGNVIFVLDLVILYSFKRIFNSCLRSRTGSHYFDL